MKDMKTIFNTLFIALVLVFVTLTGCKDEMEYNNSGVSSTTPVWPEEGANVELFNSDVATLDFKWEAANAAGAPYYQIVFYAADRTTELYRIAPSDRQLLVSVAHRVLNAVAGMAGIAPNASGDVYWAVATVKGTIEDISGARKLTLRSYQAFDDLPVNLYVTGAATEGGADITVAPKFRETGEGTYEIYTYLTAGAGCYFTNRNTPGNGRNFTVADGFLVETDGAPATPPTVPADGVYQITINFITAKVTVTAVTNVRYFVPNTNTYTPMAYNGYGKWSLHVTLGNLTSANNQYKFVANVGGTDRSWGCNTQAGQANPPQILEGDYFYVYQNVHSTTSANRARYSYRYMTELGGQEIDLLLDMSPDGDHYTHVVDAGDLTVYPVEQFIAPAEGASVALSKVAGSSQTFSWQPSSGTGPTPKNDVVFYSDAEGTNEIGTAPAGDNKYASTATVLHSAMESLAAVAGIPAEGTGDIWWSVRTTVLTQSGIAAIPPRKLTVTRLPGIPATVYITGAASEAGTTLGNAFVLKKTADGIFEIYTKLTAGSTYWFVDRTSGTPRQFSVTGGTAIQEGGTIAAPASTGVYKIVLNFNTDVADYSRVTKVEFFHPWGGHRVELTYTNNGVWAGSVAPSGWATDERYKFKVTRDPGGTKDWVGEGHRDSPPTGNPDFYYMKESIYDGEWTGDDGNMWKIPSSFGGWNGNTFSVTFSVKADAPYTHMITKN
jgi:hypothetical protein